MPACGGYDAASAASPTKMKSDKRVITPGVDDEDAHGHHDTLSYFFSKVSSSTEMKKVPVFT